MDESDRKDWQLAVQRLTELRNARVDIIAPPPEELSAEHFYPEDVSDICFEMPDVASWDEPAEEEPPRKKARKEKCPQAINMDTVVWYYEDLPDVIPKLPRSLPNNKISNDQNYERMEAMKKLQIQLAERDLGSEYMDIRDPQPDRPMYKLDDVARAKSLNRKATDVFQRMFFSWNKAEYAKMKRVLGINTKDEFEKT